MYPSIMNDENELFVECSYCGQEVLREEFVESGGCPRCGHVGGKVPEFNKRADQLFSRAMTNIQM